MNIDIYIKETEGTREVRIPWLPDKVKCRSNGTRMISFDILDQGEVDVPNGSNLSEFLWESYLPGSGHKNLPFLRGTWQDPKKIQTIFSEWRAYGSPLRIIMTGTPINHDVYLYDYNVEYESGYGDYFYDICFKARRDIKVVSTKVAAEKTTSSSVASSGAETKTHTVVSGDNLWKLAQKYYGSGAKYGTIYNANKTIIEQTAKKHGKSSSDGGHWIYPGTILQIPGGSSGNGSSGSSGSSKTSSSASASSNSTASSASSSKGVAPYKVLSSSGAILKSNLSSWTLALGWYKANGGATKGYKIVDKNGTVISA